jgi:hypothetical protein
MFINSHILEFDYTECGESFHRHNAPFDSEKANEVTERFVVSSRNMRLANPIPAASRDADPVQSRMWLRFKLTAGNAVVSPGS